MSALTAASLGQLAVASELISREQCQKLRRYQRQRMKAKRPISFGRMLIAGGVKGRKLRQLLRRGAELESVRCDHCGSSVAQRDMPRRREYPCPVCEAPLLPFAPFARKRAPLVSEETHSFREVLPLPVAQGLDEELLEPIFDDTSGEDPDAFDPFDDPGVGMAEGTLHFRAVLALPGLESAAPGSEEETHAWRDFLEHDSVEDALPQIEARIQKPVSSEGEALAFKRIGPFELERLLGEGSVGKVFLGRHAETGEQAAIKVLRPTAVKDEDYLQRFEQEVRAAAALSSEHLVRVIEAGDDRKLGLRYLGMEYLPCGSLSDLLSHTPVLIERRALEIGRDICTALCTISEASIVPRDIKPQNILLDREGRAKLGDLGMAKDLGKESQITATGVVVGTPLYIAPEQATGKAIDRRTDLYSLGLCLWQMLSGKQPFAEDDAPAIEIIVRHLQEELSDVRLANPQVSDGAAQVVRGLCAREPLQRYPSPQVALRDFELVLGGHAPLGPSDPTPASAFTDVTLKMIPALQPKPAAAGEVAPIEETLPVGHPSAGLGRSSGGTPTTSTSSRSFVLYMLATLIGLAGLTALVVLAVRQAIDAQ